MTLQQMIGGCFSCASDGNHDDHCERTTGNAGEQAEYKGDAAEE